MRIWEVFMFAVGGYGFAYMAYQTHRGYRRRRPHWTRASWLRFGAVYAGGLTLLASGVVFGEAIDWATSAGVITTKAGRGLWVFGALEMMGLGAILLGVAISWFSMGAPERPFPGVSDEYGSVRCDADPA